MEAAKPSRPKRAKRKPVTPPLSAKDKELFAEKENKYAPRRKVAKPSLGSPVKVTTVGLGKLEVITHNGNTDI